MWTNRWIEQPPFRGGCQMNELVTTLPPSTCFSKTVAGKQIYPIDPNLYPYTYRYKPIGTLYGMDTSEFGPFGKRETYQQKLYPNTNRHIREAIDSADYMLNPWLVSTQWQQSHCPVQGGAPEWQQPFLGMRVIDRK